MAAPTASLRGLLLADGCADVMQLLGRQNKTGLLRLRAPPQKVDIWISSGMVVRVEDRARSINHRLGELLVRGGLLSRQQLQEALERQQKHKKRLGHILLETGMVAQKSLAEFIRLQTRETLYGAFAMKRGTYEFLAGVETTPAPELAPGIRWEHALMEGIRRAGEWPDIRKVIPNNEYNVKILRPLSDAPLSKEKPKEEPNFLDLGDDDEGMGSLDDGPSEEVKLVLALIRPGITVQRLVDQSYLGEFVCCQVLLGLHQDGYVDFHLDEVEVTDLDGLVVEEEAR